MFTKCIIVKYMENAKDRLKERKIEWDSMNYIYSHVSHNGVSVKRGTAYSLVASRDCNGL